MTPELPLTKGALATVALLFVIALGGYFGLVAPARREVVRLEAQVNTVSAKLAGATASAVPISPTERASWRQIEGRLQERFVIPEDQLRALAEAVDHARAAGLVVTDVEIQSGAAPGQPVAAPFVVPANLALNPGIIRLSARHRYAELVDFLDRMDGGIMYVAVEALDVRRADDYLQSEIRLMSLRWQP